jgi:hypothetical protein
MKTLFCLHTGSDYISQIIMMLRYACYGLNYAAAS